MKSQTIKQTTLILLLVGLFCLFFLPPLDPDLGWQLRCGQQIWQEKEICRHNQFSVLLENYDWLDARHLYQLFIFPFYQFFGLFGLSLANSLLMLVSFILFLSLSGQKEIKIVSLPLLIFFSWLVLSFGIRNQLVSLFFLLLLLKLIELASQKKLKWFFLSPLVMFLWANSHGGFVLGVIFLLIFLFEKTIWLIMKRSKATDFWQTSVLSLLSIGATFLNPFGSRIYLEAWRHFTVVPLSRLIAEWVPPPLWFQTAIFFFLGVALLALYQTRKRPLTIFKFLVLIALAFLALKARRDLVFFFFFAGGVISLIKVKNKYFKPWALLVAMAIFFLGLFLQLPKTILIDSNWSRFCYAGRTKYAYQEVEFLQKQPEKGNIFNTYEQGGFLIWQLPEYKVFVDGRMPAWQTPSGKSPYTIYLETLQTQPGWQETLEKYKIDWLFIGPGTFMDLKIRDNPENFGWQEVYRGQAAVIYKKLP